MVDPKDLQMKSIFDDVPERADGEADLDVPAVKDVIAPTNPRTKTYAVEDVEDVEDVVDALNGPVEVSSPYTDYLRPDIAVGEDGRVFKEEDGQDDDVPDGLGPVMCRVQKRLKDCVHAEIRKTMRPFVFSTKPPGSGDFARHYHEDAGTTIPPRGDDVVEPLSAERIDALFAPWAESLVGPDSYSEPYEPDPYLKGRIAEACPGAWVPSDRQGNWEIHVGPHFYASVHKAGHGVDASVKNASGGHVFSSHVNLDDPDVDCPYAEAARRLKPYVDAIRDFNEKVNQI